MSTQDYIVKLSKGALGAIPIAGGLLGEFLEIAIVPQQQKRLNEWCEHVEETLKQITSSGVLTKDAIFNDEEFTSLFQKTSRVYVNNVEAHKKPLLQSYLKSSLTKATPLDKKFIFLDIIDKLTESQLLLLKEIYDNESSSNYLFKNALESHLAEKFTECDFQYLELLIKGLQDFHLINYASADKVVDNENQWHMRTSKIGKEFLDFLTKE